MESILNLTLLCLAVCKNPTSDISPYFFSSRVFLAEESGCLKGNCYNGYGVYAYPSGDKYIGDFSMGYAHGNGIMFYSNNEKYLGSWVNNQRDGKGRMVFERGDEYLGGYKKDKMCGYGTMRYANGNRYEGEWRDNQKDGRGKLFLQNGNWYDGFFSRDMFHGAGTFYFSDGAKFEGMWRENHKHGQGYYYTPDGLVHAEIWENGILKNSGDSSTVIAEPAPPNDSPSITAAKTNAESYLRVNDVKIWAVVVGVSSYTTMPALRYTDDDAYQFYAFLKSPEGGALTDNQIQLLIDETATRENILFALQNQLSKADANDVFMFYFSGHGIEGAFLPIDFDGLNNRVFHEELRKILQQTKAKHKLIFGDACHSGSLFGSSYDSDILASRSTDKMLTRFYTAFENASGSNALLMSSKSKEVSLEDSGLRSGIFSHFLIQGLKGMADTNSDQMIDIEELATFVTTNVRTYTAGAQTPILLGRFDHNMPVGMVRN